MEITPSVRFYFINAYKKVVYNVPPWFDKWFEKFDDKIIAVCQRWPNPIFKIFSTIMTGTYKSSQN